MLATRSCFFLVSSQLGYAWSCFSLCQAIFAVHDDVFLCVKPSWLCMIISWLVSSHLGYLGFANMMITSVVIQAKRILLMNIWIILCFDWSLAFQAQTCCAYCLYKFDHYACSFVGGFMGCSQWAPLAQEAAWFRMDWLEFSLSLAYFPNSIEVFVCVCTCWLLFQCTKARCPVAQDWCWNKSPIMDWTHW